MVSIDIEPITILNRVVLSCCKIYILNSFNFKVLYDVKVCFKNKTIFQKFLLLTSKIDLHYIDSVIVNFVFLNFNNINVVSIHITIISMITHQNNCLNLNLNIFFWQIPYEEIFVCCFVLFLIKYNGIHNANPRF